MTREELRAKVWEDYRKATAKGYDAPLQYFILDHYKNGKEIAIILEHK